MQSTKLKGVEDPKGPLSSAMEMQSSEFALLIFSLTLVQYFRTMFAFFSLEMVMFILCIVYWKHVTSLFIYFFIGFLRQGFSVYFWLSWNLLCRPGWF